MKAQRNNHHPTAIHMTQARATIRASFGKFAKPQWENWKAIESAPLWELVALAVDIDPFALTTWNTLRPAVVPPVRFHRLLRKATTALQAGDKVLIRVSKLDSDLFLTRVLVGNFREWTVRHSIKLPPEFPCGSMVRPTEWGDAEKLRLTLEIAEERQKGTKDFFKTVADRYGITPQRLQQLVGTTADRAERIRKSRNT